LRPSPGVSRRSRSVSSAGSISTLRSVSTARTRWARAIGRSRSGPLDLAPTVGPGVLAGRNATGAGT